MNNEQIDIYEKIPFYAWFYERIGEKWKNLLINILISKRKSQKTENNNDSTNENEITRWRHIAKQVKNKRMEACTKVLVLFIEYFVCLILLPKLVIFIAKHIERLSFIYNFLIEVYPDAFLTAITTIFSALLGALIGYVLTDGFDPLDDWFDKYIIEEFVIKDVERNLAINNNENPANEEKSKISIIFRFPEKEITKYVYKYKPKDEEGISKQVEIVHYDEHRDLGELDQIRRYLLYKLELNINESKKAIIVLSLCHIEYIDEEKRRKYQPYIYINALLYGEGGFNAKDLKYNLKKSLSRVTDRVEKGDADFLKRYLIDFELALLSDTSENKCKEKYLKKLKQDSYMNYLKTLKTKQGQARCSKKVLDFEEALCSDLNNGCIDESCKGEIDKSINPLSDLNNSFIIEIPDFIQKQSLKGTEDSLQNVSAMIAKILDKTLDVLAEMNEQENETDDEVLQRSNEHKGEGNLDIKDTINEATITDDSVEIDYDEILSAIDIFKKYDGKVYPIVVEKESYDHDFCFVITGRDDAKNEFKGEYYREGNIYKSDKLGTTFSYDDKCRMFNGKSRKEVIKNYMIKANMEK